MDRSCYARCYTPERHACRKKKGKQQIVRRPRCKTMNRRNGYSYQNLKEMARCRRTWRYWCLNLPLGKEPKEGDYYIQLNWSIACVVAGWQPGTSLGSKITVPGSRAVGLHWSCSRAVRPCINDAEIRRSTDTLTSGSSRSSKFLSNNSPRRELIIVWLLFKQPDAAANVHIATQAHGVFFSGFTIWEGVSQLMGSNYFVPSPCTILQQNRKYNNTVLFSWALYYIWTIIIIDDDLIEVFYTLEKMYIQSGFTCSTVCRAAKWRGYIYI